MLTSEDKRQERGGQREIGRDTSSFDESSRKRQRKFEDHRGVDSILSPVHLHRRK